MSFKDWVRFYTGLSLHDFRALSIYGNTEKEVRDLFNSWLEEYDPGPTFVTRAIEAAADEGFDVFIA